VRLLEESLEKRRLEEDMRVAAQIQNSLLPSVAPAVPGYGLVGLNRPCRTVGGDYYDFALEQGNLLMALGDVSGKGTGAALLMTVLRASVRGHWDEPLLSEAVSRINRTVCQNVPLGKYMTFFLARLDPASGRLCYVNAGHNPPLLVRADGTVNRLEEGGMVLGMFDSVPYADGEGELRRGDTLLIFSDGVTETFGPQEEEFGDDRLAELAVRGRGLEASALQDEILRELERFSAGTKATDDRTLIVLKRY
jgi:serine phosphatase RsbU (regulator of sigma subunit)